MGSARETRLRSSDEETRRSTLQELLLADDPIPDGILDLVNVLSRTDPSSAVRELALRMLGTSRARIRLLKDVRPWGEKLDAAKARILLASPDPRLRFRVAEAMSQQEDRELAAVATEFIYSEEKSAIVIRLVQVIAALGDRSHLPVIVTLIRQGKPSVCLACFETIEALTTLKGQPPPDELKELIENVEREHSSPDVRFMARRLAATLEAVQDGAAVGADADDDPLTPSLVEELLSSQDPNVRMHVVSVVREKGDPALIDPMSRFVAPEPSAKVLANMVMALKELGRPDHGDLVKPLLRHQDVRVCANAVEALITLSGEVVVDAMLPLLARDDNRLRANLMIALYGRYKEQVTGFVCRMLRSKQFSNRFSGIYCARHLDREDMHPEIVDLLASEDEDEVFIAGLSWMEQCAIPENATRDLKDLALIRISRSEAILECLEKISPRLKDPTDGIPDANTPAPVAGVPLSRATDRSSPTRRIPSPFATGLPPSPQPIKAVRTTQRVKVNLEAPTVAGPWYRDYRLTGAFGVLTLLIVSVLMLSTAADVSRSNSLLNETRKEADTPHVERTLIAVVQDAYDVESKQVITVILQGQPYRLKLPAPLSPPPSPGMILQIKSPRFKVDEDNRGFLEADEVSLRTELDSKSMRMIEASLRRMK